MGELKKRLEILYAKDGLTDEVLKLSQELDKYIAREQRKRFVIYKKFSKR